MQNRVDQKKVVEGETKEKNLGVLYTGYVEKQNPSSGKYHRRFLVLTQESIHWFNRADSNVLFGEERGHVTLLDIISVRILDEDSTTFEIKYGNKIKYFRCNSTSIAEEWVSGIRSALKRAAAIESKIKNTNRKGTNNNLRAMLDEAEPDDMPSNVEVNILLVSLRSSNKIASSSSNKVNNDGKSIGMSYVNEVVVARNPLWHRVILVNNVRNGDELVISTSNGGTITLSADLLRDKAEMASNGSDFELAVQGVPLASSIRMSVAKAIGSTDDSDTTDKMKKSSNMIDTMLSIAVKLTSDRRNTATIVLAATFLIVALSSFASVTEDTSFMFVLALILAGHCLYLMFSDTLSSTGRTNGSSRRMSVGSMKSHKYYNYRVLLHSHAFTSPDAPVNEPEDDIPQRFVIGCEYDMKEARRRWDITRHWRETEGVNGILQREQPHFYTIKEFYPHYHAGRGKEGHIVFYDRPGELDSLQIKARGVTINELVKHFIFITEYQWQILCGGDDMAKSIAVLDMANVKMSDLTGEPLEYLKKTVGIANAHYPERSYVIFAVNAPAWFSFLWRIVKPLVHENTQKKVRILSRSQTLQGLQEHIDISQIPEYYGGQLDFGGHDSCRFNSPESLALNEYVSKLNNQQGYNQSRGNDGGADNTTLSSPTTDGPNDTSSTNGLQPSNNIQTPPRRMSIMPDRRPSILSSSDVSTSYASSNNSVQATSPAHIKQPLSLKHPTVLAGEMNRRGSLGLPVNPLAMDMREREDRDLRANNSRRQ